MLTGSRGRPAIVLYLCTGNGKHADWVFISLPDRDLDDIDIATHRDLSPRSTDTWRSVILTTTNE